MPQSESNNSFFLINGGHPIAVFRRLAAGAEVFPWAKWLKRGAGAVVLSVALAVSWAAGTARPLEATARMEHFAAKMERMKAIQSDVADEIARLMARPEYDCDQVDCSAELHARNAAARNHLTILMATKGPSEFTAGVATQAPKFVGSSMTATGGIR